MAATVGRRRPATPLMRLSTMRLVISAAVIGCVIAGALACAAGLATTHTAAAAAPDCTADTVTPVPSTQTHDVGVHGSHDAHTKAPTAIEPGTHGDDHSRTPGKAPHHAAEAHPGMACVVTIDMATPTISATVTSIDVDTLESMPSGRSAEPEPPVPKHSSIHP